MINGTNSSVKKMTYSNSLSGSKSSGRHSNYSENQSNHLPASSSGNVPISTNAMASLMNHPMAAASMMHPFSLSGLQVQPTNHRHHQAATAAVAAAHQSTISPLNYFGFAFPSANDSIRSFYHAQPLSGHSPYQNSRMPSSTTSSSSPPVTTPSGSIQQATNSASTNGSTSTSAVNIAAGSVAINPMSAGGVNVMTSSITNGNGNSTPEKSYSDTTSTSSISKTNLYIRGLTPNTTDKDLHSLCSPYGNIVSTKAILDKETNKCRGYGFVDFEHPISAENAVKSLNAQGVQAQMAKCTETNRNKNAFFKSGSEHDPTNLYIANLPLNMTEADLDAMLSMYGSVISTRILKDTNGTPRGVGFARMESKEKCDTIIGLLNGKLLPGCKDTLLVKFADGGSKKRHYKNDNRFRNDADLQMSFDSTNLATNGVHTQLLPSPLGPASAYQRAYSANSAYQNALQANPWLHQAPQYIMQPQMIPSNMDPNAAMQYSPLIHQLTAQMSHLQMSGVSGAGYMAGTPHAYGAQTIYPPQMLQSMPISGEQEQQINPPQSVSSGSASGEEQQHSYQQMCYNNNNQK